MQNLNQHVMQLEQYCDGMIAFSAYHTSTQKTIQYNSDKEFLLCSTYKIPIVVCLLQQVEEKNVSLDEIITIYPHDLRVGMPSTLNQLSYSVPVQMSILNLVQFMLQESCNTASDIILRRVGGPKAVMSMLNAYDIVNLGVHRYTLEILAESDGIRQLLPENFHITIEEYQRLCKTISPEDLRISRARFKENNFDQGSPDAMNKLLIKLFNHEILNKEHVDLLFKIMTRCKTGAARLTIS